MPFLLPLFVHSYLDLVIDGRRDAADDFLHRSVSLLPIHTVLDLDHEFISPIDSLPITLPHILLSSNISPLSDILTTFKNLKLLRGGDQSDMWSRLANELKTYSWLGFRLTHWVGILMRVEPKIEWRVPSTKEFASNVSVSFRIQSTSSSTSHLLVTYLSIKDTNASLLSQFQSGLESDLSHQPPTTNSSDPSNEQTLKLGPAPKDPKLMREVDRIVTADAASSSAPPDPSSSKEPGATDVTMIDGTKTSLEAPVVPPLATDSHSPQVTAQVLGPTSQDLLPYPNNFRTLDLRREVELVREARKRIRLGPEAYAENKKTDPEVWKPSVCAFTIHDAGQTWAPDSPDLPLIWCWKRFKLDTRFIAWPLLDFQTTWRF